MPHFGGGGGVEGLFAISGYCRTLTTFQRSAQFAALDDENWALMAPSCSFESRDAAKTLTFFLAISRRSYSGGSSNVLSPGKAIPPPRLGPQSPQYLSSSSLFSWVCRISYLSLCSAKASGCCENQPTRSQRQHKNFPFTFLRN